MRLFKRRTGDLTPFSQLGFKELILARLRFLSILVLLSLLLTLCCGKKEGNTEGADRYLPRFLLHPHAREQFFGYLSANDFRSAESLLKNQLSKSPNDPSILDWIGNFRFMAGDIDSALEYYKKAIEADPSYAHTYFDRGSLYLNLEKYDLALIDLKKAVKIDPEYHDFQLALGSALLTFGNIDESLIYLSKAVSTDQNSTAAKLYLGLAYAEKGDYEKANELFQWIIRNHPDSYEAQLLKEQMGY